MNKENKGAYIKAVSSIFIIALISGIFFRKHVTKVEGWMVDRITCKDLK